MRIGLLTHNYPLNDMDRKDAGIFLYDFIHELTKKHKAFVLAPNIKGNKKKDVAVPVTWFRWNGGHTKLGSISLFNPLSFIQYAGLVLFGCPAAISFVKKNKIDYLLAAWAFPSGMFAYAAHLITGVPYATWSLGSDINMYAKFPIIRQLIILILRNADKRYANSYLLIDKIKQMTGKDCEFLPAVTNISFSTKKYVAPKKSFKLLFLGRLELVKGPDVLIRALSLITDTECRLTIAGSGTMSAQLHELVKELQLENRVKFLGNVTDATVIKLMQTHSALVIPSRSESLPLVFLEACRAYLPVIAANVGDCKQLIKNFKVGMYFQKENSKELSLKIRKMMKTKRSIYKKGFETVNKQFKQSVAINTFIKNIK